MAARSAPPAQGEQPLTQPDEWQDTQQLDPDPAPSAPAGEAAAAFPDTERLVGPEHDIRWWPEAVDGRCGENAAEFAASQPSPLNVV